MSAKAPQSVLDVVEQWLLRAILIAVAVLALLIAFAVWHSRQLKAPASPPMGTAPNHSNSPPPPGPPGVGVGVGGNALAPAAATVGILVDFGDGAQKRIVALAFTEGMTVLDAMNLARSAPHGLTFAATGRGETALIYQIDDVANEPGAAGPNSKAWQYWVNAAYGTTSVGAAVLHAGDRISWAFRKYEPNPGPPPQ